MPLPPSSQYNVIYDLLYQSSLKRTPAGFVLGFYFLYPVEVYLTFIDLLKYEFRGDIKFGAVHFLYPIGYIVFVGLLISEAPPGDV